MRQKWSNNARTTLIQELSAADTTLFVVDPQKFSSLGPEEFEIVTLSVGSQTEILKVTSRADDEWTIERAQENTTARIWPVGTIVESRITAGSLSRLSQTEIQESDFPGILTSDLAPIRSFGPGSTSAEGISVGEDCTSGAGGAAVGITSSAEETSVAVGIGCSATDADACSFGTGSSASGEGSAAIGVNCVASGTSSIAAGNSSTSAGSNSVAIGEASNSSGLKSIAIGFSADAIAENSVALNGDSTAAAAISIGGVSSGADSVSIKGTASGLESLALGKGSVSSSEKSIAIGSGSRVPAACNNSVAIGPGALVDGPNQFRAAGLSVIPKIRNLDDGNPVLLYSATPTVFSTGVIDLKATATINLTIPAGMAMYIDEVGFIATGVDTISEYPSVKIGDPAVTDSIIITTPLTIQFVNFRGILEISRNRRYTSIRLEVVSAATALVCEGRFYFRGFMVSI